jgi:NhaP-type Na+/H+ or K+/H+ antiporter
MTGHWGSFLAGVVTGLLIGLSYGYAAWRSLRRRVNGRRQP